MTKPITALIDMDIIVYRAGFASQKRRYVATCPGKKDMWFDVGQTLADIRRASDYEAQGWTLGYTEEPEEVGRACHSAKRMVQSILEATKASKHYGLLTSNDKTNYRFDVAKTQVYKGNRVVPKPIHYDAIREYLINYWDARVVSGMEADDKMGIMQTKALAKGVRTIICTIDKDMDMIPGAHYNFVTGRKYHCTKFGHLTLDKSDKKPKLSGGGLMWFYAQTLLGDSADNIPGIKGTGSVTVYNLLKDCKTEDEMVEKVEKCYQKYYTKDYKDILHEVSTLLWIQQDQRREYWRR